MTFINYLPSIMIISPIVLKILRFWKKKILTAQKRNEIRPTATEGCARWIRHMLYYMFCFFWHVEQCVHYVIKRVINSVLLLKYKFHTFRFEMSKPWINRKLCWCRVLFLLTVCVSLVRHRCQTHEWQVQQGCS